MAENLSGALATGQQICWDETHGYYLRDGSGQGCMNPDVDCSYFVGYCLQQNGFSVSPSWYTGSMITTLSNYQGFTHYIWSSGFVWQHGDIAVYDEGGGAYGHTFFYAENVMGYVNGRYGWDSSSCDGTLGLCATAKIEAAGKHNHPETGDQDNGYGAHTEVWVHTFSGDPVYQVDHHDGQGLHWPTWHIFRWAAGPGPTPTPTRRAHLPVWLYNKIIRKEIQENAENQ